MTVIQIIIALFLPWLAVLLRRGFCKEVLWAFLLQLLGHFPGVIYALWVIAKTPQSI
ncbi:MAG: YqaE/Pmp3 family membrane protein [Acidimicrobiales bacterium]